MRVFFRKNGAPTRLMILLTFISVSMGIIVLGSHQSRTIDTPLLEFETSECRLPCFMGITPGVTTFAEAADIMGVSRDALTIPMTTYFYTSAGTRVDVEVRAGIPWSPMEEAPIWYMVLSTDYREHILSLGDLLDAGYVPVTVYRRNLGGPDSISLLLVLGETEQVIVSVRGIGGITADSIVDRIVLVSEESSEYIRDEIRTIQGYDEKESRVEWIGYATDDEYYMLPGTRE